MKVTNTELMERVPVHRAILSLSIPTVINTIISLIYNLTDTFFIGLLDDPVQLGAISLAYPVFMIIQAIGNIFGHGAPSYISRCLGAKKFDEVKRTSAVSVYIAAIVTVLLSGAYFLFRSPIVGILGTSPDTIGPTTAYLNVIIGFAFIMTLQVTLPSILRAEGRVKEATIGSITGIVLNIILDPIFILALHQGVAGAAWATIIGNTVAVIYYLFILVKGHTCLSVSPRDFRPSKRIFAEVLKIGLPSSISTILMSFSNILMQNLASGYGDYVISAYGVSMKLVTIVYMITLGYVSGYTPFAGYNFGAQNYKRLLAGFKFVLISATGICIVFLIPFIFLSPAFMGVFTDVGEIIDTGVTFLRAYAWCVPIMGIQVTHTCIFQSTGSAVKALIVNLGRQCVFYMPLILLMNSLWGLTGLIYASPMADILTTITAVALGIPMLRKLRTLSKEQEQA